MELKSLVLGAGGTVAVAAGVFAALSMANAQDGPDPVPTPSVTVTVEPTVAPSIVPSLAPTPTVAPAPEPSAATIPEVAVTPKPKAVPVPAAPKTDARAAKLAPDPISIGTNGVPPAAPDSVVPAPTSTYSGPPMPAPPAIEWSQGGSSSAVVDPSSQK